MSAPSGILMVTMVGILELPWSIVAAIGALTTIQEASYNRHCRIFLHYIQIQTLSSNKLVVAAAKDLNFALQHPGPVAPY